MSRSLILSFHSASKKYSRLQKHVKKSISRGEFWRFTKRKRSFLLHKIDRLRRRLGELRTQLKFAAAGTAAALMLMAATASAQTSTSTSPLGPFNPAPLKNPMPPPAFPNFDFATVSYADMDGDGDLDATVSSKDGYLVYYENQGNAQRSLFRQLEGNPFEIVSLYGFGNNRTRVTFDDIDDDGDMDMLAGQDRTDDDFGNPDHLFFYRGDQGPNHRPHFSEPLEQDPFRDIGFDYNGWPLFADVDGDGDKDLIVCGYYLDVENDQNAWVQFYRNDKVGNTPDVDPVYVRVPADENPFYLLDGVASDYVAPAFEDMDEDGDLDFIYATGDGLIHYRRNDNGVYVDQTETSWTYNAANPGASTGNPFKNLFIFSSNEYRGISFSDLDGDGDKDLTIGLHFDIEDPVPSGFTFIENKGHGEMTVDFSLDNPVNGTDFGDYAGISAVDYDQDGDIDLVGSGTQDGHMGHIVIRNDEGVYVPLVLQADPFTGLDAGEGNFIIVDLDGDSDLDVFVTQRYSEYSVSVPIYYENQNGEYVRQEGEANPLYILDDGFDRVDVDFADLDGDDLLDLVLVDAYSHLRLYKNTGVAGEPAFTEQAEWESGFTFSTAFYGTPHPKFIDIDNDGDMDIIVGKYDNMWYYENIGTALSPVYKEYIDKSYNTGDPNVDHLTNPFTDIDAGGTPDPTLLDFDGDGDKDLLFGDPAGQFTYYENQNPAPVVTQSRTTIVFSPNDDIILDPNITLSDPDNDKIARIVIAIDPFEPGKEELNFDDVYPDIQGNWNGDTGELTLTGTASIADFQAALRSVEYSNSYSEMFERKGARVSANGRTFTKTITFHAFDSDLTLGPTNTQTFNVTHSNDEPVITPGVFNVTYNTAPLLLIPAIDVTDSDDATLSSAEVSFSPGTYRNGEDQLSVTTTGGGITPMFTSADGVLHLDGVATVADYQAMLRSIVYNNLLGAGANATPRTLTVTVFDSEGESNIVQINLSLFVANPPPVLAPATAAVSYTGTNLALNTGVTVTDDGSTITSATIMFTNGFVFGEDKLLFTTQNGITGTFNDTTAVLALLGSATLANYQAALRSIQYSNVATTRTAGARTVSFTVNDGSFNSNASTVTLTVPNSPPTIVGAATALWVTGELVINNNIVLTDIDNTTLQGATVTISSGFNVSEDVLVFIDQNGITGSTSTGSGTLTLSGVSSVSNYQAALRSVKYKNTSSNPSVADRQFTFAVTDGGTTTTLTGSLIVINKPPAIDAQDKKTRAGGNIALAIDAIISDPDDNLDLATLAVTSARNATITISGGIITVDYSSQSTFEGMDQVTITVCDTGGRCTLVMILIEVGADPLIYTGMSPNGDGVNDWFHIEFLPPLTEVSILNRWGDAVFETNDYDVNDPAKRFEGKNKNGTEVISGSYFYKVRFPDGTVKTGNILLNR